MLTKCPGCDTTFRVTPAQLKARAGKVRCGQCSHVFNAIDTLVDELPASTIVSPALPPASRMENQVAAESPPDTTVKPLAIDDYFDILDIGEINTSSAPAPLAANEGTKPPAALDPRAGEGLEEAEQPGLAPPAQEESEPVSVAEPPPLADYLANPLPDEPAKPARRWPWVIASVFAVVGLLAQGIYFYRVELSVLRPDIRPLLQAACKSLQFECDTPYPRHADTLSIDASDLRPDPQQPGHLTLTATLRSKAPYAQEWPLLELTLTDVADRKLAVKDFAARDYLPRGSDLAAGFPANGEIAVSLPLDVGDLSAAGYRLYMFYP